MGYSHIEAAVYFLQEFKNLILLFFTTAMLEIIQVLKSAVSLDGKDLPSLIYRKDWSKDKWTW